MRIVVMLWTMVLLIGCSTLDKIDGGLDKLDKGLEDTERVIERVGETADRVARTVDRTRSTVDRTVGKVKELPKRLEAAVTGNEEYVVENGDSLWAIDIKKGGDGFGWVGIWKANRDFIEDYDLIEPGERYKWNRFKVHELSNRERAFSEPPFKGLSNRQ